MDQEALAGLIFITTATASFVLGLLIFRYPDKTFDIQKRFYRMINWNIEPIDFNKEMRNTKLMALFLILFALAASIYFFSR